MRFPGNCLLVALLGSIPPGARLHGKRNRSNRLHFYWTDRSGRSWEFYKKGASTRTYLQNLLYVGEVRRALPKSRSESRPNPSPELSSSHG